VGHTASGADFPDRRICGGFTTFSTFSLDAWYLIERGQVAESVAYMLASVVLSFAALVSALHAVRALV